MQEPKTDFGYQTVSFAEKTQKVKTVFHSVASEYDLMNDIMSLGIHRLWKRFAISIAKPHPKDKILDLAGGTGDLSYHFAKIVKDKGLIVLSDINESMLSRARDKLINQGLGTYITYLQANAENLPFPNNEFNIITIAFGLRNISHKEAALTEMYRALKPGGKLIVLEFSKPILPALNPAYNFYSFKILPKLGRWVAKDEMSYQYLVESIRMHPSQEVLKNMMHDAGFEKVDYYNLSLGIVAVHVGYKY